MTAILFAADNYCLQAFSILEREGASIDVKNENGDNLLHIACSGGSYDIIDYLLQKGFDINSKNEIILYYYDDIKHIMEFDILLNNPS